MKTSRRLLIVDDEPDRCANLADIFQDLGYEVEAVRSGPAAPELARRRAYEVAILVLQMPEMNGLELYHKIRAISAGTVAIVVTAYVSAQTAVSVLDAGAWRILPKPVDIPRLVERVREALDQPLVLVVDDDEDFCQSFWDILRSQGYRACVAHDVVQAEGALGSREYDTLIVDMKPPLADGCDVIAMTRSRGVESRIVLITGYRLEMASRVEMALAQGASAVFYKPFKMEELLDAVRRIVPP